MPRRSKIAKAPAPAATRPPRGSQGPPTGAHTPHNGQPQRRAPLRRRPPLPAVRPAVRGGYGRSGRLHAPEAARTGPLSAFRPYFSWTPQGQWFNGQNGHFSCQPGRNRDGTPPTDGSRDDAIGTREHGPITLRKHCPLYVTGRAGAHLGGAVAIGVLSMLIA